MTKLITAAGIAILAGAATFAVAQPSAPGAPMAFPKLPITRAEAIADVRALFARFDANKDGFVTRDELPRPPGMPMVQSGGPDMLFDAMDKDKNGQISRAEFDAFHSGPNRMTVIDGGGERRVTMIRRPAPGDATAAMPGPRALGPGALGIGMLFDRVDTNNDAKLSAAEAEAAALERFDRIDDNHDGTITPEERQAHAPRRMAMRWRQDRPDRPDRMPPPSPMPAQ